MRVGGTGKRRCRKGNDHQVGHGRPLLEAGLQGGEIGLGAAVSLFLFPVLLAVVFLQLRLMHRAAIYE